ncbi:MAG: SDR family NAD(P)-dependent oxidoreductase [Acetobacteraceae bacterium]|nr:SDR family NAD(P)-dependent oxidoreductase [Acetobacteraceae bacterium]
MQGRSWVITGASSGIGRAVAERAGQLGGNVVLAARRPDALAEVARRIEASGGQALVVAGDLTAADAPEALARAAVARFGAIHVWFNNAGVLPVGRFEEIPVEDNLRAVTVNLGGAVGGSHAALMRFRAQGHGVLLNMASVEARVPLAYHAAYAATTAGVLGLDMALRQEIRLAGLRDVRLVTIMPFTVDTPLWQHAANRAGRQPRGFPYDDPRAVADAIVWAALHAPSGEFPVGMKAQVASVLGQVAPGPSTWAAGRLMDRVQMRGAPAAPVGPGNLHAPIPGPTAIEGGMRGR